MNRFGRPLVAAGLVVVAAGLGGTAIGIAAAGVVLFHVLFLHVPGSRPTAWAPAFQWALLVAIVFVVATLAIAVTDVELDRRARSATEADATRPESAHRP